MIPFNIIMDPTIILVTFFFFFFIVLPVGFGILIYVIFKRGKENKQKRIASCENFAKANNMTYQKEVDDSFVEGFRKFTLMNQHSYMRTLTKGVELIKNPIKITNYMRKVDESGEWEIFDCVIFEKNYTESSQSRVNTNDRLRTYMIFSIKTNMDLNDVIIKKSLKYHLNRGEDIAKMQYLLKGYNFREFFKNLQELNEPKIPKFKDIDIDKITKYEIFGSNINDEELINLISYMRENSGRLELEVKENHVLIYEEFKSGYLKPYEEYMNETLPVVKEILNKVAKL